MTTPTAALAGTVQITSQAVPRIGFGMGSLTRTASTERDGLERGVSLLHHARELGIRLFDTAQFYGDGMANRLLAAAFVRRRDEVFLASKVGARPLRGGAVPMTAAQRPRELRAAVEDNLATLGTDHLDLVYLRRMDMAPGLVIADGDHQQVALDDQLAELSAMRDQGLVRAIGLSHVTREQLEHALPAEIAAVSNIHNYLDRSHEDLLALCMTHQIAWAPYFPLGGGFAGLPRVVDDPTIRRTARHLEATPNQVGLAWVLHRSPLSVVIAGTSSTDHLVENTASAALRLPDDLA